MAVIPVPGTKVDVACTLSRSGGVPAWASPCESAIEKQEACAAAISSSGLVRPSSSGSERDAQVMSAPVSAPLPVNSILPVPLSRFPLHETFAVRSAAMAPPVLDVRPLTLSTGPGLPGGRSTQQAHRPASAAEGAPDAVGVRDQLGPLGRRECPAGSQPHRDDVDVQRGAGCPGPTG